MKFAEFSVGQIIEVGSHQVNESDIVEFATRFDPQPFHVDKAAAAMSRWQGLIASGFHTVCIAMRLMVDFVLRDSASCGSPGLEYLKWTAPVRPGDTLSLKVHVLEVRRSRTGEYGVVRWQWRMFNHENQLVLDLVATSLFET
jgi:acyl dehydratase